jgi:hypothetical protein
VAIAPAALRRLRRADRAARSAGHVLACTRCGTEFFPRIDPAIIVLVSDARRALLGRQRSWAPGPLLGAGRIRRGR